MFHNVSDSEKGLIELMSQAVFKRSCEYGPPDSGCSQFLHQEI